MQVRPQGHPRVRLEGLRAQERDLRRADLQELRRLAGTGQGPVPRSRGRLRDMEGDAAVSDPAFLAQLEHVRKRAQRERAVIVRLDWRHGQLRAELVKRRDLPKDDQLEAEPSIRGVQAQLL